jgi:hypothetical protein
VSEPGTNRIDRSTLSETHLKVLLKARENGGFELSEIRPEVWEAVYSIAMHPGLKARYRMGALRLIADRTDPISAPVSGNVVTQVAINLTAPPADPSPKELNGRPQTRALPHSNGVQIRITGD